MKSFPKFSPSASSFEQFDPNFSFSEYLFDDDLIDPSVENEDCLSFDDCDVKEKKAKCSKDSLDRRRERNRLLAKKTRIRKKYFFEALQIQYQELSCENEKLKRMIKQRLSPEDSREILSKCLNPLIVSANEGDSEKSVLIPSSLLTVSKSLKQTTTLAFPPPPPSSSPSPHSFKAHLDAAAYHMIDSITSEHRSFVITDPSSPDNPIIFASSGFLSLCGYPLHQVLGRNCRFLQGPATDPRKVEELRNYIHNCVDTSVCLLNYRSDGSTFFNQIFVSALRNVNNEIINHVGVQIEISEAQFNALNEKKSQSNLPHSHTLEPKPKESVLVPTMDPDLFFTDFIDGETPPGSTISASCIVSNSKANSTSHFISSIPSPSSSSSYEHQRRSSLLSFPG